MALGSRLRWRGVYALVGVILMGQVDPALAASSRHHRHHHRTYGARAARQSGAPLYHAELLMDADSGRILFAQNEKMQWPPASMAKMMLLAVAEDQIKAGRVSYSDPVRISERSATTTGSHLGLHEGDVYPLGELMKAALIRSANDAAVAVAEKVAGSVEACVRMMNLKAQALGMDDTYYGTVDGLPPRPNHDVDHTTAVDLAVLARAVIHNTGLLRWSSMEKAPFDGGRVTLRNTNHLIGHLEGCDGLKTGFTSKAGFNLTATVKRGDMRLISVVLGAPSNPQRFIQSSRLLDWGFDNFAKVHLINRGQALPVHVQVESGPLIQPVAENDVALVLPKRQMANIKLEYSVPSMVQGPLTYGESLGQVIVRDGGDVVTKVDAVCPMAVGATDNHGTAAADSQPVQSASMPAPVSPSSQENR